MKLSNIEKEECRKIAKKVEAAFLEKSELLLNTYDDDIRQALDYTVHLGSGVIHQEGGPMINVLPVHSQRRGRIFLPFVDEDPKTAEILTKILFFAEDEKIKDPFILEQIV